MNDKTRVLSTVEAMTHAFHLGDINGILRTYEPGAVVVGEPGAPVQGDGPLRAMFAGFIAANARFTFDGNEVIIADDLALHLMPWKMTGTTPDGSPVSGAGLSVAVLRRQANGSWLMVIDDPYGDAILLRAWKSPSEPEEAR